VRWPPVRAPVLDAFGGCAAALMPVCRPWSGEHSSRPVVTGRLGLPGSRRCRRLGPGLRARPTPPLQAQGRAWSRGRVTRPNRPGPFCVLQAPGHEKGEQWWFRMAVRIPAGGHREPGRA